MACHTRHCATLEGQGRSRVRPSAISPLEGRAEPKTLDRLVRAGLPRLPVWPSPPKSPPQVLLARVHCIAVHGSGMASNVQGCAACQIVVPFSFNKDRPRLMLEPWKCCAMVALSHCAVRYTDATPAPKSRSKSGSRRQAGKQGHSLNSVV